MGNRITVLRTEYPDRDLSMIDVLNAGCSKGHALERWAAHRGFRREEVMAIGDNHNDVEMLEFAGHPVIMGNACEELRGRGWKVTLGNDQCGVAAADRGHNAAVCDCGWLEFCGCSYGRD
jgi:hydroxymethylpyrimidine pyrophosphatase-like HAD family hydrolase